MAYFDRDEYLLVWLAEPLADDALEHSHIHLMGTAEEPEADDTDPGPSCGYIIRGWFGPFLFGPASRSMRGRC